MTTFDPGLAGASLSLPGPVMSRRATESDRPVLERLWLLFRHHMSTFSGALPNPDATYRSERLDLALSDPGWAAWLLFAAQHPIGFALTRSMNGPVRVLNSFFLVAPARRQGTGTAFARDVVSRSPGRWEVAYQDSNQAAVQFWSAFASSFDAEWTWEHRPAPGDPTAPPDTWLSFTVRRPLGSAANDS